ncbi:MAG: agmatine deiminase family protein [Melioribacteraceae bacterium]|nr:agmatine deiminase family protein [Melioribacteraceae bacterium]MDD3558253.1 agmatine deiminase family protein [Melioribacteraceae bacterium]
MKKLLLFLSVAFIVNSSAQNLPRYLTESEKQQMKSYTPPLRSFGSINPPSKPVRTMAEWEELEGVMITWTGFQNILRQIVDYAQDEGKVYIVCSDSNSVKSYLTAGSVPLDNLKFIIAPFNSIWVRDYGPWCVYSDIADSMYVIDWIYNRPRPLDDLITSVFAEKENLPLYQMTQPPYDFVATGGNFMNDSHGKGFSSKLILNENPAKTETEIDTMMNKFMGISRYIKLDNLPYDVIHHIDMHMKLLDEETLLVGQYPVGVADGPKIEENLQYILNNYQTCFGREFRVVRIPMPPDAQGRYPNNNGDYRTYTNSIIINKTVIVPTYELQYDTTALRIYREAMPGYEIAGVNSNQIIPLLGAIHCITKEIGVREPIFISHPKILTTVDAVDGYEVKSFIKTRSGVQSASVYWSIDTTQGFNSISMSEIAPDTFSAEIPLQSLNTKVYYYISAISNSGRTVTKPLPSPAGAYQFMVDYVVPVELTNFSAMEVDGNIVLEWSTTTESNNMGFEIERSTNKQNWIVVGFKEGNGTTSESTNYQFNDPTSNINSNKLFYQLKQIDYNGRFKYSNVVEVLLTPTKFLLSQNYPNPFNPTTKIKFTIPSVEDAKFASTTTKLVVYDILGREVATLVNKRLQPGEYEVEFNAENLSSGVYYYRLGTGSFSQTKKMVLMR